MMSKKIKIILATGLILGAGAVIASKIEPFGGQQLEQSQIKDKWGDHPINLEKFKTGELKDRSSMAFQLIQNKNKYIGKTPTEIRELFGYSNGRYVNELFPAYVIEVEEEPNSKAKEMWQLVFLVGKNRKIDDVVIMKMERK